MKPKKLITALCILAALIAVVLVAGNRAGKGKETGGDITPGGALNATGVPIQTTAPTLSPTASAHEHEWVKKEIPATCTNIGMCFEECACGALQNKVELEALNHPHTRKDTTRPATEEEEGTYVIICFDCGQVIEKGILPKLVGEGTAEPTVAPEITEMPEPTTEPEATTAPKPTATSTPTPEPTAAPTATPKPTNTPTPTPSPKPTSTPTPTPAPACEHKDVDYVLAEENSKEEIYEVTCNDCNEILEIYKVPKATPTPTPSPTPKPVVIPTATPVPDHGGIVKEDTVNSTKDKRVYYADGTKVIYKTEWLNISPDETLVWYKLWAEPDPDSPGDTIWTYEEILIRCERKTNHGEMLSYYMYIYYDCINDTYTSRLVNSDGSFNRYSGNLIMGNGFCTDIYFKSKYSKETGLVDYLAYLGFGHYENGKNVRDFYLYPEDFIYRKDGEIRLYDY